MPYFGSTIEGAANTAWQADNSIRDRLAGNAWRINDALARNRQMELQGQEAALSAMRMAQDDAARQYFRNLDALAQAAQMNRSGDYMRSQIMAQQNAADLQREQLELQSELARRQAEMEENAFREQQLARERMPELLAPKYFQINTELEALGGELGKKQNELLASLSNAARLGGYFDAGKRKLIMPKPEEMSETAKRFLPLYASKIEQTLNEIELTAKKINDLKAQLAEISNAALQFGFTYGKPSEQGVPVASIYRRESYFVPNMPVIPQSQQPTEQQPPVQSPSQSAPALKRYRFNPETRALEEIR